MRSRPTWQDLYIWLCYAEVIQYQCVCVTILLVSSLPRWIVRLFFINYVGCIMSWLWPNMTPNSWIPQKRPTAFKIVAPRRASIHKFTVSYPPPQKKKNPGFFGAKSNPPVPEYTSAPSGLAGLKVCAYFGDLEVRLFA